MISVSLCCRAITTTLEINGKRGSVELAFNLVDGGEIVGRGKKHMLLSGLREYDKDAIATAIVTYNDSKKAFASAINQCGR